MMSSVKDLDLERRTHLANAEKLEGEVKSLRAQLAAEREECKHIKANLESLDRVHDALIGEFEKTVSKLEAERNRFLIELEKAQEEIKRERALHNSMAESRAIYATELDKVTRLLRDLVRGSEFACKGWPYWKAAHAYLT